MLQTVMFFNLKWHLLFNFGDVFPDFLHLGFQKKVLLPEEEKVPNVHFLEECTHFVYPFLHSVTFHTYFPPGF